MSARDRFAATYLLSETATRRRKSATNQVLNILTSVRTTHTPLLEKVTHASSLHQCYIAETLLHKVQRKVCGPTTPRRKITQSVNGGGGEMAVTHPLLSRL
eukprot:UN19534